MLQVVTDSAAQAPHWTDAAQAAADGNDSHAAALRHTVALSAAFEAGRRRYSMADFAGPTLGQTLGHNAQQYRFITAILGAPSAGRDMSMHGQVGGVYVGEMHLVVAAKNFGGDPSQG